MKQSLLIVGLTAAALLLVATYSGIAYADATSTAVTTPVDGIVAFACASNGAALKWFLLLLVPLGASLVNQARKYLPAPLVALLEAFSGDFVSAAKVWVAHKAAQPPVPPKS